MSKPAVIQIAEAYEAQEAMLHDERYDDSLAEFQEMEFEKVYADVANFQSFIEQIDDVDEMFSLLLSGDCVKFKQWFVENYSNHCQKIQDEEF